ncbi:hypothetical protein [Neorhizobium sp. T25_13]|uniref:hypothetical protein n=1 Tax=Neorhizobium sp. T25_13 TaxID=2093830 RepID=UPI00155DE6D9|nr:hypothetical protein [Neorhizobium sp. T25_13]
MPSTYAPQISMSGRPRTAMPAAATLRKSRTANLGKFSINTIDKVVDFDLPQEFSKHKVMVHGFVPKGWKTDALWELEPGKRTGSWSYSRAQERNIVEGLSYISVQDRASGRTVASVQIEPDQAVAPKFENFVTITAMAGQCAAMMTIFGQFEDVEMKMEPAQVIIARSAAVTRSDGLREQEIGCAIRVGGAEIQGLGKVQIGMFGAQNPGKITSMSPNTDFPARMSLDVGKSYITPVGDFYRDNEVFLAEGIQMFPPFGVKFNPVEPIAPLRNAQTGHIIGQIKLGWLVPLCYLDPGETEFPSKAISNAKFEEEP